MPAQLSRILIALCGILGTVLLALYFGVGFSVGLAQLPSSAIQAQVVSVATQYHTLWYLGTWLQATGSLLSVVINGREAHILAGESMEIQSETLDQRARELQDTFENSQQPTAATEKVGREVEAKPHVFVAMPLIYPTCT